MLKLRQFFTILLLLCPLLSLASVPIQVIPRYTMSAYDQGIQAFYQQSLTHAQNLTERIDYASAYFLGRPYQMFPVGEGPQAEFDKSPLYRTDVFDCMTYVNTVLALARSNNLSEFQQNFIKINYEQGQPDFFSRNHFVTSDWNESNAQEGYIKDITGQFKQVKIQYARTWIDKPNWYRMMLPQRIRLFVYPGDQQAQALLTALRAHASQTKAVQVNTPYIPLTALYDRQGQPNMALFNQIPDGTIIEVVRPNWDLTQLIGTHLNISHLGFAVRTSQGLMFRQASLDQHKVTQVPLITYLKLFLNSSVKGINIELPVTSYSATH